MVIFYVRAISFESIHSLASMKVCVCVCVNKSGVDECCKISQVRS